MADIFISYARDDLERVRPIAKALEAHGWDVWWDIESIRAGQSFNQAIRKALRQAKCVVVLWSKTSAESEYVEAEAYWAKKNKKLVSVVIDDGLELPVPFNTTHSDNLSGWSGDTTAPEFKKLISDLTAISGIPPAEKARRMAAEQIEPEQQMSIAREPLQKSLEIMAKRTSARIVAQRAAKEQSEAERPTERKSGTVFRDTLKDGSNGPEMVVIPSGSFLMGSPEGEGDSDEWPQHKVTIAKPFAIGRYPVTFDAYDRFAEATGRDKPDDAGWGRGRRPVINVTWDDATEYAKWLSRETGKRYRLPTEARWEYAARAGTATRYYWGDEPGKNHANFDSSGSKWSGIRTSPVGSFDPNPFGLYDMLGNVVEWCEDCWHDNYFCAPNDGSAWLGANLGVHYLRPLRGGHWNSNPTQVRASYRFRDFHFPTERGKGIGFRVLRPLSDEH